MTEHKTQLLLSTFGNNIEMLIGFDVETKKYPVRIEECHGEHRFSEDETGVKLTSVEIIIKGRGIDILPQLTDKEKEAIIEELEIFE